MTQKIIPNRFNLKYTVVLLGDKLKNYKILLASQSPRRQELLKGLGIDFSIVKIKCDETYPKTLRKEEITEFISKSKVQAYSDLQPTDLLIAADTIVWMKDTVYGKPKNKDKAREMLESLSGNRHEVFTSVTIKTASKSLTFSDSTEVFVNGLSAEEIDFYIENYQPFDKAGSYGIQDWFGLTKVSKIKGNYYNVMGLPVQKLYQVLMEEF